MGKIITILGNIGVGKTTAARSLCDDIGATYFGESHEDRPFQALAKENKLYTFHNQVNYLLERAKQEEAARKSPTTGVFDGGLDMDHYVFNKLFLQTTAISNSEYDQLNDLYLFLRRHLPHPDMVIVLNADPQAIEERFLSRDRINLASLQDMAYIDQCLKGYINTIQTDNIFFYDTTNEAIGFQKFISFMKERL